MPGAAERELLAPQLRDALLGLEQQLGREVAERHDHAWAGSARAGGRATARTPRSRRAADRGCPAAGTSRRWRCTRRRGSGRCPRSAGSGAGRPGRRTARPCRSSCSPGPFADEHQVGVGAPDAEHHLGAAGRELAQRAAPTRPPRPRRASRRRRARDAGMRRTSRVTRHSPGIETDRTDAADATGRPRESPRPRRRRPRPRRRSRWASTDAGGERDRRGRRRSGCARGAAPARSRRARSARARWHASLSSAASVTTTTSVVLRAASSSNGAGGGKAGRVGRRGRARERSCRRRR